MQYNAIVLPRGSNSVRLYTILFVRRTAIALPRESNPVRLSLCNTLSATMGAAGEKQQIAEGVCVFIIFQLFCGSVV